MNTAVAYAPNRYHRVQMNTVSLNYAPTKRCACSSLKGVPLHCIIFRTATDPCMGSGSLLLNVKKYAKEPNYIRYYGQELNTSTFNLARMNMFLHGIVAENQKLRNGDTLDGDWPTGEETDFNMVLMNPPLSLVC